MPLVVPYNINLIQTKLKKVRGSDTQGLDHMMIAMYPVENLRAHSPCFINSNAVCII